MNRKYSNFLTILLIVVIIAIIGIIGFLGYKYYEAYIIKSSAEEFVNSWDSDNNPDTIGGNTNNTGETSNDMFEGVEEGENTGGSSGPKKYNGFLTAGTIEIPATKLKCPVLDQSEYSPKALETSVVVIYGVGLNQPGNTTIVGHNYRRNGVFFSDNKKLNVGDKIFITDGEGRRLAYTIYDKYETTDNDAEYMTRDTQGAIEVSLSTCTDDSKSRIIILARADV